MMYMHHNDSLRAGQTPCACTTLRKASRAVTRLYDGALSGQGMTTTQFAILRNLARAAGVMPLSRLAERLVMERTTLYRTLTPIERAGWVRIVDGEGRAKNACLTDNGRQAMDDANDAWETALERIRDTLDEGEWERMLVTLTRLTEVAPA